MRLLAFLLFANILSAQTDFSGSWRLNHARSTIRGQAEIPWDFATVTQNASAMTVAVGANTIVYPLSGKSVRSTAGELTFSIATKWEGAALLANIIVGGPRDYTLFERWVRSRDGGQLTVTRTIEGHGDDIESTLIYESGNSSSPPPSSETEYILDPGTRILLRLTNPVNSKFSVPGDHVYLQTAVPVFQKGKLIIPQGSYVQGTVTESQRGGRIKGKASVNFRFDTLTLPNGVGRDFHSRAGSMDAQGNLDKTEGRVTAEGGKGKDTATIAKTTAGGAGIGSIAGAAAGSAGMGAGVGAAAGAIAGLAGVLGSHGKDVVIPQGTTMEMVLDRELRFKASELSGIR